MILTSQVKHLSLFIFSSLRRVVSCSDTSSLGSPFTTLPGPSPAFWPRRYYWSSQFWSTLTGSFFAIVLMLVDALLLTVRNRKVFRKPWCRDFRLIRRPRFNKRRKIAVPNTPLAGWALRSFCLAMRCFQKELQSQMMVISNLLLVEPSKIDFFYWYSRTNSPLFCNYFE